MNPQSVASLPTSGNSYTPEQVGLGNSSSLPNNTLNKYWCQYQFYKAYVIKKQHLEAQ